MDSLSSDLPQKQCTGPCGRVLPATSEFFHRDKHQPDGLCFSCKQCRTAKVSSYNKEHRDARLAYDKQYYADHKQASKERNARWVASHRPPKSLGEKSVSQRQRTSTLSNLEHKRELSRNWYWRDVERNRQKAREYFQTERGKQVSRAHSHRRRARKAQSSGSYTVDELLAQLKRQKERCYYCGVKVGKNYHADHVIPLSRGGYNDISNIVIACARCNRRKHNKLPHEWPEGGRLL